MSAAEYRLRSFESQWVGPLLEFQNADDGTPVDNALRWLFSGGRLGPDYTPEPDPKGLRASHGLIRVLLLKEAAEWIQAGQEHEYFDRAAHPRPITLSLRGSLAGREVLDLREPLELWDQLHMSRAGSLVHQGPADASGFASALHVAIDDVTVARVEYLRLVLFAPDDEWQSELSQVWNLRDLLTQMSDPVLSDAAADSLSWALSGSDSAVGSALLPSDWRTAAALSRMARAQALADVQEEMRQALVFSGAADARVLNRGRAHQAGAGDAVHEPASVETFAIPQQRRSSDVIGSKPADLVIAPASREREMPI